MENSLIKIKNGKKKFIKSLDTKNTNINIFHNKIKSINALPTKNKIFIFFVIINLFTFVYWIKNRKLESPSECPDGTHSSKINDEKVCLINCQGNLFFEKNGECVSDCDSIDFFNKVCTMNNETIEAIENMIKTIKEDIVRNRMNSYLTNNLKIKYEKETYQLSTLSSQKNNNSGTILDFPDCEKELKNAYLLDDDIDLIIFKMDYFFEDFFIPITEYQLFHPFNFSLLDLKYCKDIIIKIPLEIDESELYKHNPNSEYYTNGDNKILNERKKYLTKIIYLYGKETVHFKVMTKLTKM